MTIYKTAYDTSACSGFRVRDVQDQLEKGALQMAMRSMRIKTNHDEEGFTLHLLEGGNSAADVIPYFRHPVLLPSTSKNVGGDDGGVQFAVDVRNFGKYNAPQQVFIVKNAPEFAWNVKRAILNHVWVTERPEILRDISPIPAQTYSTLLAECISHRFALDPAQKFQVQALAAFFYYGLFFESRTLDEMERNKLAGMISRATKVPAEKVFEWLGDTPLLNSLEEFCQACAKVTGSVALDKFNTGVLVAIAGGTWYGTNSRENIAVALEHVPTWIMCVEASLSEATFKRSMLAKISSRFDKQGAGDAFSRTLNVLLGGDRVIQEQVNKNVNV